MGELQPWPQAGQATMETTPDPCNGHPIPLWGSKINRMPAVSRFQAQTQPDFL